MDQKQWKQNQRIQNRNIYNKRIKRAFLPVTSGLLALMVMESGCALPGNSGRILGSRQLQIPVNPQWLTTPALPMRVARRKYT